MELTTYLGKKVEGDDTVAFEDVSDKKDKKEE